MEDNVQNNQIMDSWEEGSGDKSSDISSALDIIEFILSTDSQENTADSNEINTGATRLSTTIYQLESKTTETSKENSGPANKNRQFGASHERATETKDRNVNQETVQGGYRRGSSPDSRTETMVTRGISRSSPDPNNGTQIQEDTDYNEVGEMDKDSTKGEMRQFKDVPVKVSGSDAIPPTKQDGDGDDGRGLESISTSDSRYTSIVTAATLDDEEELLMKNNRPRKYQSTPQNSDKGIKKGEWKAKRHRQTITNIGLRTQLQRIEEEPENPQSQHEYRRTNKITEWIPGEENHILEHPQQRERQSSRINKPNPSDINLGTEPHNGTKQNNLRTKNQDTKDGWKGKRGHRREHSIYRKGDYIITESWCNPICSKIRPIPRQESCVCGECPKQCRYCIKDRLPSRFDDRSVNGS
nr:V protein [Respirovirus bovis]